MIDEIAELADFAAISPSTILGACLDHLQDTYSGLTLTDNGSPFTKLLDMHASTTAMALHRTAPVFRRLYPILAQSMEELFHHMSNQMLVGVFSSPSKTVITHAIAIEEIKRWAKIDPVSGLQKMVIPKDTVFSVGGKSFYMHFPIVITVLKSGELHTFMDAGFKTPLVTNSRSNLLKYGTVTKDDVKYIAIQIPVEQLSVSRRQNPLIASKTWDFTYPLDNQFYYARVYWSPDNTVWNEMNVTHSDYVYDISVPTALLRLTDGTLKVTVPDIYRTNALISGSIRVEIFTTEGALEMGLADYLSKDWSVTYLDASNLSTDFALEVSHISNTLTYSTNKTFGGTTGLSFEQVKAMVIYGKGLKDLPVTREELAVDLDKMGYSLTTSKRTFAGRTFVATRQLPSPKIVGLSSPIGTANRRVIIDVMRNDLPETMIKNGDRVTITPYGLYTEKSFSTSLLPDAEVARVSSLGLNDLADELNVAGYYYTPFHYVLDASGSLFQTRAYRLSKAYTQNGTFVASSPQLGFVMATNSATLELNSRTYTLRVVADAPGGLISPYLQISYRKVNGDRLTMTTQGVALNTTQFEFVFALETTLDINSRNEINITNLIDNTGANEAVFLTLETSIDMVYLAWTPTQVTSPFDTIIDWLPLAGLDLSGVVHETVEVVFGEHLEGLFAKGRPILSEPTYLYHTVDVPDVWEKDVPLRDASGIVYEQGADGKYLPKIKHKKGDPVLVNGRPKLRYRAGVDVVLDDSTGLPVEVKPVEVLREVRICLMDARYRWVSDDQVVAYRDNVSDYVSGFLAHDIVPIRNNGLIEQSELYFEPSSNVGSARVSLGAGREQVIKPDLSFHITVKLMRSSFGDSAVRDATIVAIRTAIADSLKGKTFSLMEVYSILKDYLPVGVAGVEIANPISISNSATLVDGDSAWAIATSLRPLNNGKLGIFDDIVIDWINE